MVRITVTVDVDPEHLAHGNPTKPLTVRHNVTNVLQQQVNHVPKQKRPYNKRTITKTFRDYSRFRSLLKELACYGQQLAQMTTPEEICTLVNCPSLRPFKLQLLDKNFCTNLMDLYDKCLNTRPQKRLSMQTVAEIIREGLATKGFLLKYFGDFPTLPANGSREDLMKFRTELKTLQRTGKLKFNEVQRKYIKQRLAKVELDMAALDKEDSSATPTTDGIANQVGIHGPLPATPTPQAIADQKAAFAFFLKANPDMSKAEATKEFSHLDHKTRGYFCNLARTGL